MLHICCQGSGSVRVKQLDTCGKLMLAHRTVPDRGYLSMPVQLYWGNSPCMNSSSF
jgi:hypothetical protein